MKKKEKKIIRCHMCNSEISKNDQRCPKCGSVLKRSYSLYLKLAFVIGSLIVILTMCLITNLFIKTNKMDKVNEYRGLWRFDGDYSLNNMKQIMQIRNIFIDDEWGENAGQANYVNGILVIYGSSIYDYSATEEEKKEAFCFKPFTNSLKQIKCSDYIDNLNETNITDINYIKE